MANYIVNEDELISSKKSNNKYGENEQNQREGNEPANFSDNNSGGQCPQNACSSGHSGAGRFLFWLTVFYWVFSIICCAGMLGVGWEMGRTVRQGITEQPEEIRLQTERFFGRIAIPAQFKPAMALTFKQPFSGTPVFFGAVYAYSNPERDQVFTDVITVGTFSDYLSEELRDSFRKKLTDEIVFDNKTRQILQNKSVQVTIDGVAQTFESVLSVDSQGNHQLSFSGLFHTASGQPAFIIVSANPKTLSESQIIQMLQTIQAAP